MGPVNRKSFGLVLLTAAVMVTTVTSSAQALTYTVTGHQKSTQGPSKLVTVRGTYARTSKLEQLSYIWISVYDKNGREVAGGKGIFNRDLRTWEAGIGDFRMVYYRVTFVVNTPAGDVSYWTPAYRW